jgi:hypothetical protein
VQQGQQLGGSRDCLGDDADGGWVVQIAAGRGVGQQQVVADQRDHEGDVLLGEAHSRGDGPRHFGADDRVVAGVPLADVVQQRADQQQIGARDIAGQTAGLRSGLHQVPVHGEAVDGIVLGLDSDHRPFRDEVGHQPGLVQLLEHDDPGVGRVQDPHQVGQRLGRPRHGHRRRFRGQPL